jgi:hypothetical protein
MESFPHLPRGSRGGPKNKIIALQYPSLDAWYD